MECPLCFVIPLINSLRGLWRFSEGLWTHFLSRILYNGLLDYMLGEMFSSDWFLCNISIFYLGSNFCLLCDRSEELVNTLGRLTMDSNISKYITDFIIIHYWWARIRPRRTTRIQSVMHSNSRWWRLGNLYPHWIQRYFCSSYWVPNTPKLYRYILLGDGYRVDVLHRASQWALLEIRCRVQKYVQNVGKCFSATCEVNFALDETFQ